MSVPEGNGTPLCLDAVRVVEESESWISAHDLSLYMANPYIYGLHPGRWADKVHKRPKIIYRARAPLKLPGYPIADFSLMLMAFVSIWLGGLGSSALLLSLIGMRMNDRRLRRRRHRRPPDRIEHEPLSSLRRTSTLPEPARTVFSVPRSFGPKLEFDNGVLECAGMYCSPNAIFVDKSRNIGIVGIYKEHRYGVGLSRRDRAYALINALVVMRTLRVRAVQVRIKFLDHMELIEPTADDLLACIKARDDLTATTKRQEAYLMAGTLVPDEGLVQLPAKAERHAIQ